VTPYNVACCYLCICRVQDRTDSSYLLNYTHWIPRDCNLEEKCVRKQMWFSGILYHRILDFRLNYHCFHLQFISSILVFLGTVVAQWLRYCTTNQKVAGSIPDGVMEFFIDIKPDRTMALGSTASNRNEYRELLELSNFRHVVDVVCFLLGSSPESEFYIPMFRNSVLVPSS
jgi:hypothetical protein